MSSHNPLTFSRKAQQDFIDILRYTGEIWGKDQLLVYRDKIDDALRTISLNASLGHRRDDLSRTHLVYPVGSHVIIYRMETDRTAVVRILHQRMSLTKKFGW